MSEESSLVTILIVGGGTAGWMSAALLSQFRENGYRILLVESEDIGTVGVGEATIPQINLFNAALGIDEDEFLRATQGTIKLGIEFVDWLKIGHRYMHAFGAVGRDVGIVPFQHYWQRARRLGSAKTLDHYSLNEVAARAGKMQRGSRARRTSCPICPMPIISMPGFMRVICVDWPKQRGVERIEGKVTDVTLECRQRRMSTSISLENGAENYRRLVHRLLRISRAVDRRRA